MFANGANSSRTNQRTVVSNGAGRGEHGACVRALSPSPLRNRPRAGESLAVAPARRGSDARFDTGSFATVAIEAAFEVLDRRTEIALRHLGALSGPDAAVVDGELVKKRTGGEDRDEKKPERDVSSPWNAPSPLPLH